MNASQLAQLLHSYRYTQTDEAGLQNQVALALADLQIAFSKEHRLNNRDIVDFWVEGETLSTGLGLEIKVKGSPSAVARQLLRYAQHERVDGLVLLTTRATHNPAILGTTLNGKPLEIVSVWKTNL